MTFNAHLARAMANVTIAPPMTPDDPINRAIDDFYELARRSTVRAVKREAEVLLDKGPCYRQDKLLAALYGTGWWHRKDHLPSDETIRKAISAERKRAGTYLFNSNRLTALRGHLLARRFERRYAT